MKQRLSLLLLLLSMLSFNGLPRAEEAAPAPASAAPDAAAPQPKKNRFGPRDVEVRLQDGSLIRGEIQGVDSIALKTAYGTLNFPVTEVLCIEHGERLTAQEAQDLDAALKDLDSDQFTKRSAAQYKLESFGASALQKLKEFRQSASPEGKNRVDAIIKKINARNLKKVQSEDVVKSNRFEAQGILQMETLDLKSRFGSLRINAGDIRTVRWLDRGENKSVELEANAALQEWLDTGMDTVPGDKIAVSCSGTINLFNSANIGPVGTTNWSGSGPFLIGAVIARTGAAGEPFLIGKGKTWVADSRERLYLKIFCTDEMSARTNDRSKGQFSIKVATGAWVEDLEAAGAGQ